MGGAERLGDALDRLPVAAVDGPAAGEIGIADGALQALRNLDDVALLQLRARRHRIGHALARVGDEVLDVGEHAGADVGIAVARYAAARGADAGEVVLARLHVAGFAVATPERQRVGLDDHLEERVVPAHTPGVAVAAIVAGDVGEARVELVVARFEEGRQPLGIGARGHAIGRRQPDLGRLAAGTRCGRAGARAQRARKAGGEPTETGDATRLRHVRTT